MERKIGEIFEYNGEWYQCLEEKYCNGCVFRDAKCDDVRKILGNCSVRNRSDKKSVIFKKLEKIEESPCKSCYFGMVQLYKLPYWNNGMVEPVGCHFTGDGYVLIEIKENKEEMGDNDDIRPYDKYFLQGTVSNTEHLVTSNLKPFDIQKAREGKPVCTRDGRNVRIIAFDAKGEHPIIALVTDGVQESPYNYTKAGYYFDESIETMADLMMLPEKKEGWVNVYKGGLLDKKSYPTKKEAFDKASPTDYVDTIKINWSE